MNVNDVFKKHINVSLKLSLHEIIKILNRFKGMRPKRYLCKMLKVNTRTIVQYVIIMN